jgi:acetyl-CoA carboxylase biotin carboxyl carrier protein
MDHDEIKKVIEFLKDTDVTELLIEKDGSKLKIKREKYLYNTGPTPPPVFPPIPEVQETVKESVDEHYVSITSPIVGIFHRAPSPEAPPYVDVGTVVRKGQVLCIVEAMKLMNEIESDTNGIIKKIPVENGQPVEYGETLFLIEPSS